ncbi:hypothetical protein B0H21DRAFT_727475 [Amylocystis lapponica]|nr:hypothetical protein B0H21DRAFT_727475 [Amylocystis lapponica]
MATAAITPDIDEYALRRTHSTGDLPDTPDSARPGRRHRRSDSQAQRGLNGVSDLQHHELSHFDAHAPTPIASLRPAHMRSPSIPIPLDMSLRQLQDVPRSQTNLPPTQNRGPRSWVDQFLVFLGYSGVDAKARRELVSLIFSLSFGFVQYVVVIALLVYSAHHESVTMPGLSEWEACSRPLGVWDSLWLIRTTLNCSLSVWSWQRARALRMLLAQTRREADAEAGRPGSLNGGIATSARPSQPRVSRASGPSASGHPPDSHAEQGGDLKHTHLYSRLSILTSFVSLAWFLTAHIFEYTSVNTCRLSSPHLWWLTFGILCVLYLMVLEIFLLGLLVFFVGPLFYLFWNVVLLCLGRHPLRNPHYIKPEIGKLPKSIVDKIPLVLYIPPPPEVSSQDTVFKHPALSASAHSYPPKPPAQPKRRFAFLRSVAARKGKNGAGSRATGVKADSAGSSGVQGGDEKTTWEDNWEPGEYPFVRLEGNRAACAICLLDFEEPKRVGEAEKAEDATKEDVDVSAERPADVDHTEGNTHEAVENQEVLRVQVEDVSEEERKQLRLDDAGEGAQPLRLLGCGHVFHKTCVDPWLTDVSGRCPICQRPVEVKPPPKKKDKSRRTS